MWNALQTSAEHVFALFAVELSVVGRCSGRCLPRGLSTAVALHTPALLLPRSLQHTQRSDQKSIKHETHMTGNSRNKHRKTHQNNSGNEGAPEAMLTTLVGARGPAPHSSRTRQTQQGGSKTSEQNGTTTTTMARERPAARRARPASASDDGPCRRLLAAALRHGRRVGKCQTSATRRKC